MGYGSIGCHPLRAFALPRTANLVFIVASGAGSKRQGMPAPIRYEASFVQREFALEDFTTASMKAMPRMPSSIFG